MMHKRGLTAVLVVTALLTGMVGAAGASEVHGVDDQHDLADDAAIDTYEERGVVTGDADELNMTLTIADDCGDAGHETIVDLTKQCLRVQYNEDVPRTVRIWIPRDYWTPYENQNLRSADGSVTAEMEPINDRQYAAVTVHLAGKTDAVFEINTVQSKLWGARERSYRMVNGSVDIEVPRIAGSNNNPWTHLDSSQFAGNESYSINTPSATVQYDASAEHNDTTWVTVPKCSGDDAPVCRLDRGDKQILVPDTDEEIPAVRYKDDASRVEKLRAGFREVGVIVDEYVNGAQELIGGVFG